MQFTIFTALFWFSLATLVYVFFGFILLLWLYSKIKQRPVRRENITPTVSLILCAFNEAKHMERKLANCLELDYPPDKLEFIVVSDGSTDETDAILARHTTPRLRTFRMPYQHGKSACQNLAAAMAKNQVLFFTDATVMHPPNALKLLVPGLADSSVGCVTGKPIFKRDAGPASKGLSAREKYELYLRSKLGGISTLFGAQDCIYVIPRELYRPVRADLDSGFVAPLQLLENGYRTVYEPEALAFVERPAPGIRDEFIRRSRICLRGMRGLIHMRRLMNPFKYGFVALSLISARLLRWLSPLFLLLLLISNLFLISSPFYLLVIILQAGFYGVAAIAFFVAQKGYRLRLPFYVPLYFCVLICSAAVGLKRLLAGETGQMWQTRR
jgi:cellulose synthase/poly-beta-1,6-N-acetylglucosamine synthase-like glycosyltransferase